MPKSFKYYRNKKVAVSGASGFIGSYLLNELNKHAKLACGISRKKTKIGKLKFLFHKTFNKSNTVAALVFGVIPKFQKLGLESALANHTTNKMLQFFHIHIIKIIIFQFQVF